MNIVSTILDNKDLTNIWKYELNDIMCNINITRILLRSLLENKLNKDFSDITSQKGMTYYSNLTIQQILEMRKHGIYIRDNGNISLTNINKMNIEYITNIWCKVIKN
jgi:aspartate/tyrosine/aromatic aminotransferase